MIQDAEYSGHIRDAQAALVLVENEMHQFHLAVTANDPNAVAAARPTPNTERGPWTKNSKDKEYQHPIRSGSGVGSVLARNRAR